MSSKKEVMLENGDVNTHFLTFHTNFQICDCTIQSFNWPLRDKSNKYLNETGPVGKEIVKKIMKMRGVTEIFIQRYELSVKIADLFDPIDYVSVIEKILMGQKIDKEVELSPESLWHHFVRSLASLQKSLQQSVKKLFSKYHR